MGEVTKGEATSTGLSIIEGSGVLLGNLGALQKLSAELQDTHVFSQQHRTRTEMEVSVLQDLKHPTPDAKYWQAMREQDVQYQELVMLSFEYRQLLVKTEKLRRKLTTETDELDQEFLGVKIARNEYLLKLQERTAFHRLREICEWSDIKRALVPSCKYSLKDVNQHQLQSLSQRFDNQAGALTDGAGVADRINILGLQKTARRMVGNK